MIKHFALIALFVLLTAVGMAGGWLAARQGASPSDGGHGDHGDEAAPKAAAAGLDARTLANLGVEVAPAEVTSFTRTHSVQGMIQDRPQNRQPVVAPVGGIVTQVHVAVGSVADAGAPLATLLRDPVPRPKPDLTADILTPISEEVHDAVSKLRSALGRMRIVEANLERVRRAAGPDGDVPVLRKSRIEYENERARLQVDLDDAHHELERHGLTDAEIDAVASGKPAPSNRHLWEHALRRSGLWSESADAIRAKLPERDRALPWCVIAIGELSAAGLADPELATALEEEPALALHFAEAASLLLQGFPLDTVRLLAAEGALGARVVVRAPSHVGRWDVASVAVRPGQRVQAGEVLVGLHDARTMWLRLEPVGEEIGLVVRALEQGLPLAAVPLVEGAGPVLEDLTLQRIDTHSEAGHHAGHAYADVANELIAKPDGTAQRSRSWRLRTETRYLVQVPVKRIEKCIVLPTGAVTRSGPSHVVFLRDGSTFRPLVVRLLHEDDRVVVLPADTGIFPGDPVAVSGAFALKLALDLDAGSGDDPTGHGHAHN